MTEQELIRELPKGLLKWYDFQPNSKALSIVYEADKQYIAAEILEENGLSVERILLNEFENDELLNQAYDYIVMTGSLEYASNPIALLKALQKALKPSGKLLLGTENRLAIRYFCGDRDPFTGRSFDGVENYKRVSFQDIDKISGKLYSKAELLELLKEAGFIKTKFYSVFPELYAPQVLLAEGYEPAEELNIRIFPQYHSPDTVFLEEENLYTSLIKNKMFHTMANAFFIECSIEETAVFSPVNQVTVSMDRGKENALCTILGTDCKVRKKTLYKEGIKKLFELEENCNYLVEHKVPMIQGKVENNAYVMPLVKGNSLVGYLRNLMRENSSEFYRQMDMLWEMILHSSEQVAYKEVDWENFDPWWNEFEKKNKRKADRRKWREIAMADAGSGQVLGPILKRGYIDLALVNGFHTEEGVRFFDQEIYMENLPARAIMIRNIDFLYHGDNELRKLIPHEELYKRYGIGEYQEIYQAQVRYFLTKLRNDDILEKYHKKHRVNAGILNSNRQRMNYSTDEYLRLFVNIFNNMDNRKLYLFGSGNFTKKFLALYGTEYEIAGILDNNEAKWGERMEKIEIFSPNILKNLEPSTYKVIICIKSYTGVLSQVKALGASNIGIYDTNMEYPRKPRAVPTVKMMNEKPAEKKKYHVGYVAGVFDLFHIGHLNLLRRAKEQCDYLIVGVVTDEGVIKNKKTNPVVPFEERVQIVQACRYVDEAVGIPLEFCDTKDAYLKFQFDAQFSGSDYEDDPAWGQKQEFLREHGAELVFFPYTKSTSSTKRKEEIKGRN